MAPQNQCRLCCEELSLCETLSSSVDLHATQRERMSPTNSDPLRSRSTPAGRCREEVFLTGKALNALHDKKKKKSKPSKHPNATTTHTHKDKTRPLPDQPYLWVLFTSSRAPRQSLNRRQQVGPARVVMVLLREPEVLSCGLSRTRCRFQGSIRRRPTVSPWRYRLQLGMICCSRQGILFFLV